jgi:hypothetical protein
MPHSVTLRGLLILLTVSLGACAFSVKGLPTSSTDQLKPIPGESLTVFVPDSVYGKSIEKALQNAGMFVAVKSGDKTLPNRGYALWIKQDEVADVDPMKNAGVLYAIFRMWATIIVPIDRSTQVTDKAVLYRDGIKLAEHNISYTKEMRFSMLPLWMLTGKPSQDTIDQHAANQVAGFLLEQFNRTAKEVQP